MNMIFTKLQCAARRNIFGRDPSFAVVFSDSTPTPVPQLSQHYTDLSLGLYFLCVAAIGIT
jgi:hypothetical protein